MKIALVTDTYTPQVNGVTTVCRRIVTALRDAGHAAAIVAPRYGARAAAEPLELRVRSLPFPPYPSIRLALPRFRRVAAFLEEFRPELVHVATEGPIGALGRRWALRAGIPLVTSYHTDFPGYARHYGAGILAPLVWRWLMRFHRPAKMTHTPGEAIRDALRARGLSRTVVWGRGVDVERFRPEYRDSGLRRWMAGGDDTVIVLHVGRLAPEKNVEVLAKAFQLVRKRMGVRVGFVIAGEGPSRRWLEGQVPFARFLGFLDPDTLSALYACADLCVLPSFTETCGLVALEAMASGLPVVAADAGGLRESVRHEENGLLTPPHDAAAFAAAIIALVADRTRRQEMGTEARHTAMSRSALFENAALLEQYAAIIARKSEAAECAA